MNGWMKRRDKVRVCQREMEGDMIGRRDSDSARWSERYMDKQGDG